MRDMISYVFFHRTLFSRPSMRKNHVLGIALFLIFSLISTKGFSSEKPQRTLPNLPQSALSQVPIAPISINEPWARASLVSTSAAFMHLENNQAQEDTLVRADSDICETVELHTHIKDGDIMRMRPLKDGIPLAAHHSVSLKPGGLHIMLIGLKRPLLDGEKILLKLHFQKAGIILLSVPIRKPIYKKVQEQTHCGCEHNLPKPAPVPELR